MSLPSFLLLLATGLALLAPFLAGHVVLTVAPGTSTRLRDWFGLTVGIVLLAALPLAAMDVGLFGPSRWTPYRFALVIAVLSMMLGLGLLRAHARRRRGDKTSGKVLAFACLGLAAGLGLFLLPWILGAPMPIPVESGRAQAIAGSARAYAALVLPAALLLAGEAWSLATEADPSAGPRRWLLTAHGGLAVFFLLSLTVVPVWSRNPSRAAELAKDRIRVLATNLDLPRRAALAGLLGDRAPALTAEPCRSVPDAWLSRARFGTRPKDWASLTRAAGAWRELENVNVWYPDAKVPLTPHRPTLGQSNEGPLLRFVIAALDSDAYPSPWTKNDAWLSAAEARQRVEGRTRAAPWHVDGTLVVTRETPSFASYGESNLGQVQASLWLWSYDDRAWLCGGRAEVSPDTIADTFGDAQAAVVRNALRMRALALAITDLRTVGPPR